MAFKKSMSLSYDIDPLISKAIFAPGLLVTAVVEPADELLFAEGEAVAGLSSPESTKVTLFIGTLSLSAIARRFLSASN
jgi:hypothetical protein